MSDDVVQKESAVEKAQETISQDVDRVKDHLRNNRTTETEAADLQEAARRSLTDHAAAKSLGRAKAKTALLAFLLGSALALPAHAQGTQLTPPGVLWGSQGAQTPIPTQQLGYDSGTSAPCIVGSTATCKLAVSAGSATLPPNAAQETGGNLAAILAKITADPATQTTLAAVLAKLTADPSTATLQGTTNTDLGAPGATACATDTGSCSLNALVQRLAQRLTTAITALGTPMQATGGTVTARIVGNGGATLDATVAPGTAPANMQVGGGVYNATPAAPTDTQSLALQLDETGRLRTTAQPAVANKVTGTASQATGGTSTSLIALVSAKRIYVVGFSCANTGTTASLISFQDGSGGATLWTTIVPAGGGSNLDGNTPLFWTTAGTALYFVPASSNTTVYCSAAGFSGS